MRQLAAAAAAAAATALGALILGEYEMAGWTPYVSGVLFGLVIAELVLTVAKPRPHLALAVLAVVLPALGMLWAVWISAGRDVDYVTDGGWASVDLAPLAAALWLRQTRRGAGGGAPT